MGKLSRLGRPASHITGTACVDRYRCTATRFCWRIWACNEVTAIILSIGDIFDSGCDALVSPVSADGAQGKGLALQFRQRFPFACAEYKTRSGERRAGTVWTHLGPPVILFAATKLHWRGNSCLPWIRQCAADLVRISHDLQLRSIGVPMLGAGLGGLRVDDVRPILVEMAREMYCSRVVIFEPR
jgi:O-acetyl-ADP-ribose deacetylase (regulator of RNase III)